MRCLTRGDIESRAIIEERRGVVTISVANLFYYNFLSRVTCHAPY